MSKITNDSLTRSGTGCFTAVGYPYGNSGLRGQRQTGDVTWASGAVVHAASTVAETDWIDDSWLDDGWRFPSAMGLVGWAWTTIGRTLLRLPARYL